MLTVYTKTQATFTLAEFEGRLSAEARLTSLLDFPLILSCVHLLSLRERTICWSSANFSYSFSFDITLFTLAESLTSFPVPKLISLPESTCSNRRHGWMKHNKQAYCNQNKYLVFPSIGSYFDAVVRYLMQLWGIWRNCIVKWCFIDYLILVGMGTLVLKLVIWESGCCINRFRVLPDQHVGVTWVQSSQAKISKPGLWLDNLLPHPQKIERCQSWLRGNRLGKPAYTSRESIW